ncbi:hypothetical protein MJO29_013357 [Puccinia striiformis f. sp. tritici]|nr:hypothetical protein MJO29_013357 [Puccinia striiformis f. sp. tritici]
MPARGQSAPTRKRASTTRGRASTTRGRASTTRGRASTTRGQASTTRGQGRVQTNGGNQQLNEEEEEDEEEEEEEEPVGFTLDNFEAHLTSWTKFNAWRALATNQKEVFDARIFAYFSKLPIHFDFEHNDEEPDEDGSPSTDENQTKDLLTPAEKALYKPLYEDLVNHEKVKLVSGGELGRESNTGSQALKHIDRINSELFTICNAYNLTFYLLSATRHPGTGSFCRESTNDPYWLPVAKDRWKSKETFEAYSHGRAVQEVVEECLGLHPPPEKKLKTLRPADGLRSKLRKVLNKLLGSALGVEEAQFPKGADPISLMAGRFPEKKFPNLKIIRSEECQLAAEIFALGFEAMHNPHRVQWLADIENGHFKITNTAEP